MCTHTQHRHRHTHTNTHTHTHTHLRTSIHTPALASAMALLIALLEMALFLWLASDVSSSILDRPSVVAAAYNKCTYIQYASKKPVRICAESRVAAVHINSRITLRTPTHVDRTVLAQPSVHRERRAAKAWCVVQH